MTFLDERGRPDIDGDCEETGGVRNFRFTWRLRRNDRRRAIGPNSAWTGSCRVRLLHHARPGGAVARRSAANGGTVATAELYVSQKNEYSPVR